MKTFARIASVLVLATVMTGATFASGNHSQISYALSAQTLPDVTTIGSTEVAVTPAIRAYFTAHGVDGTKIDVALGALDQAYKDSIDTLYNNSDRYFEIQALVQPALKAALVRGSVEQATMRIGRHLFTLSIDGPEDHNDE